MPVPPPRARLCLRVRAEGLRGVALAAAAVAGVTVATVAPGFRAGLAVAAEVPSSAYAQSLGAEPDFLEHPALLFVHPQRAALEGRQLFALDTNLGPGASGGVWTLGLARVSLLSPRRILARDVDDMIVYPISGPASRASSALRAGVARPVGPLRLGLSAAGEIWKTSSSREVLVVESENHYAYEYSVTETNWRAWSALAGIGAGSGRRALDLTYESRWEQGDDVYIRARQSNRSVDTLVVSFEGDERPIPGAHLRARVPLGRALDLLLVGDWSGNEERRPGRLRGSLFGFDVDSSRVETGYRDAWKLGLAGLRALEPIDFVLVSAVYRMERGPSYSATSQGPTRSYSTVRSLTMGAAAREPLRTNLFLQAGLRRTYRLTESSTETGNIGSASGRHEVLTQRSDQMAQEFDWGLDWTWRNLRLTGALSTTLNLERPFLTLDATLAL